MHMATNSMFGFLSMTCLITSACLSDAGVQSTAGRQTKSNQLHELDKRVNDVWVVLPTHMDPSESLASKYRSIGYALYEPSSLQNSICVTRLVQIGFPSDENLAPEIVATPSPTISRFFVAFLEANSTHACRELDFQSDYIEVTQPIATVTLRKLRQLLDYIPKDHRAREVSEGRSLDDLRISSISADYSAQFADLVYRLSVRDEDGPLLSVTVGDLSGYLRILDIRGLAE